MKLRLRWVVLGVSGILGSCSARQPAPARLTIAAAANLADAFAEVGLAFKARTGADVIFTNGATAQLAQQIGNGAPFDLFAAADTQHIDALIEKGKLVKESRAVYAIGQLALWIPKGEQSGIRGMKDLGRPEVRYIAIAQPELAPYGVAAVEALKTAGLWETLQPKVVYANSISQARQFAASGNAEAAFTAYSLVLHAPGVIVKVDRRLYRPIEQALAIVASSAHASEAAQFRSFLLGPEGRAILESNGYLVP